MDQLIGSRSQCRLHSLRHVGAGPLPEPLGALLHGVPGHRLRGRLLGQAPDGGGQGRVGHAPPAPRHQEQEDSHPLLRQQDGHAGGHVQREGTSTYLGSEKERVQGHHKAH